jgi:protein TonB
MALGKINIFDNNWVDLVFKGRNHEYGAYVLRKKSDEYTVKGIVFAIIFFTLTISAPVIINYIEGLVPKQIKDTKEVEVTLKEPPPVDKDQPPPPPPPEPPPLKSTIKFPPPEIKPDEQVKDEPIAAQEEMKDKDAGPKTEEGDPNGIDKTLLGDGDGTIGDAAPEIVTFAEQMPEFEGGDEARISFLQKNINYPPLARENSIEARVQIQFVVGLDGKISEVTPLTHKGWGLEEEAVRVVKMMPPWKPGKQNGKTVPVRFSIPIVFKLAN